MNLNEDTEIICKLTLGESLTPSEQARVVMILTNRSDCQDVHSFDQGSKSACLLQRDHVEYHRGFSRGQIVSWK